MRERKRKVEKGRESDHEGEGQRSTSEREGEIERSTVFVRERGEVWGIGDERMLAKMEVREFSFGFNVNG